MKINMLTGLSGPELSLSPGDPHECDDLEAARLVLAGFADTADGNPLPKDLLDKLAKLAAERSPIVGEQPPEIIAPKRERATKTPPAETRED